MHILNREQFRKTTHLDAGKSRFCRLRPAFAELPKSASLLSATAALSGVSTTLARSKSDNLPNWARLIFRNPTANSQKEAAMAVKPIPEGYNSITPYLIIKGASAAIDFYKKVFGATEIMRMPGPDGKVMHAELRIGNSVIMLADEQQSNYRSPQTFGGSPVSLMLYVPDVDKTFQQAVANGATESRPVKDQFYGDRSGNLVDPFGHIWTIATHVEDVSEQEMQRRMAAMPKSA
jgi:PhnB protein